MMKELCKKVIKIEPFWSFQNDESKIFFNHGEGMIDKYSITYLRHDIFIQRPTNLMIFVLQNRGNIILSLISREFQIMHH